MDSHMGPILAAAVNHGRQSIRPTLINKVVFEPKKHVHNDNAINKPCKRYIGAVMLLISIIAELCILRSESLVLSDINQVDIRQQPSSNFAANSRAQPVIANDLAEQVSDSINSTTSGAQQLQQPQRRQAPVYQSIYQQPSLYHKQPQQQQQPQAHSVAVDTVPNSNNPMAESSSPSSSMTSSRSSSSKLPIINGNRATYVEPPADFKPIIYDSFATAASESDPYLVALPPGGAFGSAVAAGSAGGDGELGAEVSSNHLQQSISIAPSTTTITVGPSAVHNSTPKRQTQSIDPNKQQPLQHKHNQQADNSGETFSGDNGGESSPLKPSIGRWSDWHDMSIEPDLASSDSHLYVQQSRPNQLPPQQPPPQPQAISGSTAAAAPTNVNGVHSHRTRYGSMNVKQANGQSHFPIPTATQHQQQSLVPSAIPADSHLDAARQKVTSEVILEQQQQQPQQSFPSSVSSSSVVFPHWSLQSASEPRSWANTQREVQQSRMDSPPAPEVQQQQDNILSLMRVADYYHKRTLQQQQRPAPLSAIPSWKLIHREQHQVSNSPLPLSGASKMIKMRLIQRQDDGGNMNEENNSSNGNHMNDYPHQFHNYRRARNPLGQQQRYFNYYLQQNHNGDQSMAIQGGSDGEGSISSSLITKLPLTSPADPTDSWVGPSQPYQNQQHWQQMQQQAPRTQDHLHHPHHSDQPAAASAHHEASQSPSSALISMPMSTHLFQPHTSPLPDAPSPPALTQTQTTSVSGQQPPMPIQVLPLRSSAPKRRRRKSKTTNAEVRIQQLVVAPSSASSPSSADSLPMLAPVASSDKTGTKQHIRQQQHPPTYSQLIQQAEQARDMSLLKQVNGLNAPQKAANNINAHHHLHQASHPHRSDYNQHQSVLVDTASQHIGINANQIENHQRQQQLRQANSAASLSNRQKPAVLVRRFGAPMAQLSATSSNDNNGIGVNRKANGGGQAAQPKRVLRRRRIKTVLPVGLSTWILGGIRDLDGRHWQLPADVINRLAVNDVDLHHDVPISSVQPPGAGNVEILNGDGGQYVSSTTTTISAPETENTTPSTHKPMRPPSQLIPR